MKDVLIVEAFYGGSHHQLIQLLRSDEKIASHSEVFSLPAKKWHWRARTASLYFSQIIPQSSDYRVLFTSSVLNLAELSALRPDLARLKKILYFHENQLVYPVQKHQDRDFQYGYNQILSCMVADVVVFNSAFNMESFLSSIPSFLKLMPDYRPKNLVSLIHPKCQVLHFPMDFKVDETEEKRIDIDMERNTEMDLYRENNTENELQIHVLSDTSSKQLDSDMLAMDNSEQSQGAVISENCQDFKQPLSELHVCCSASMPVNDQETVTDENLGASENISGIKSDVTSHSLRSGLTLDTTTSHQATELNETTEAAGLSGNTVSTPRPYSACSNRIPDCLHIVWPHRWEHDKDPNSFFSALFQLQEEAIPFQVSVVGETFSHVPDVFALASDRLTDRILAWGYQSRADYLAVLKDAHVVVSTAQHEFFGVAVLEAVRQGCYPLCPNRLVYPELYPKECLYSTHAQLVKKLKKFCQSPQYINTSKYEALSEKFSWERLKDEYIKLILPP